MRGRQWTVPFTPPFSPLRPWSVRAFNALYYRTHKDGASLVDYDSLFFPLDRVSNWNRVYGPGGFVQYQAFFPSDRSREGLRELLETVREQGAAPFLAVLKTCGRASRGVLSFLKPGHTLALDLPNTRSLTDLVAKLDRALLRHGGRVYLAKDATVDHGAFAEMYLELPRFRAIKATVDAGCRFASAQARRLRLVQD